MTDAGFQRSIVMDGAVDALFPDTKASSRVITLLRSQVWHDNSFSILIIYYFFLKQRGEVIEAVGGALNTKAWPLCTSAFRHNYSNGSTSSQLFY